MTDSSTICSLDKALCVVHNPPKSDLKRSSVVQPKRPKTPYLSLMTKKLWQKSSILVQTFFFYCPITAALQNYINTCTSNWILVTWVAVVRNSVSIMTLWSGCLLVHEMYPEDRSLPRSFRRWRHQKATRNLLRAPRGGFAKCVHVWEWLLAVLLDAGDVWVIVFELIIRSAPPDWQAPWRPAALPQWCMLGARISSSRLSRYWQMDFFFEKSQRCAEGAWWTQAQENGWSKKRQCDSTSCVAFLEHFWRFQERWVMFPYRPCAQVAQDVTQGTMRWQRFACAHIQTPKKTHRES